MSQVSVSAHRGSRDVGDPLWPAAFMDVDFAPYDGVEGRLDPVQKPVSTRLPMSSTVCKRHQCVRRTKNSIAGRIDATDLPETTSRQHTGKTLVNWRAE